MKLVFENNSKVSLQFTKFEVSDLDIDENFLKSSQSIIKYADKFEAFNRPFLILIRSLLILIILIGLFLIYLNFVIIKSKLYYNIFFKISLNYNFFF